MEFKLRPARRGEIYTRALFFGESGHGKTYSALTVAFHLADLYGYTPDQIAVLDTETVESAERQDDGTGSAEKYAGRPCNCNRCLRQGLLIDGFQTMILEPGHRGPEDFMRALEVCKQAGIKIVILDGITDEWRALLQIVDSIKAQSRGKNDGWSDARPLHNRFERACMEYPGHLIATCRAKRESRHKKAEEGMGDALPDQDSNVVYLYDVAVFFKRGHAYVVKSRDDRMEGSNSQHPGADLAAGLKRWCDDPRAKQASAQAEHQSIHNPQAAPIPDKAPNVENTVQREQPANGNGGDPAKEGNADLLAMIREKADELHGLGRSEIAQQSIDHADKVKGRRESLVKLLQRQGEVIEEAKAQAAAQPDAGAHADEGFDAPF